VCIDDDLAFGGLSEDLGQPHDWRRTGRNNVRQHLPGPDRWQLIDIADEQQRGSVGQSAQQSSHQRHIDHRSFVDDQQLAVERCFLCAPESSSPRIRFALALWIAITPAPRPSLVAILHPPQQDQASWIATAGRSGLVLRAVTSAMPPSDRAFELWAIAPGATQPRSLGVISPNGELKLSRLPADLRDGATLAISIEPIGGSPTQLPSGPVVYIGSVKAV